MHMYTKFMTEFWKDYERKIIEYFRHNDISTFSSCPQITHAMVAGYGARNVAIAHISNYQKHIEGGIKNIESFIEMGAGTGALCEVIKETNKNKYTIIDIPIINKIQQYCLKDIKNVNYLGLDKLEETDISCDMFISIYALSESSNICIEHVLSRKFFNANHILVGFYKTDTKEFMIEKYISEFRKYGQIVDMDPTSYYLIK